MSDLLKSVELAHLLMQSFSYPLQSYEPITTCLLTAVVDEADKVSA